MRSTSELIAFSLGNKYFCLLEPSGEDGRNLTIRALLLHFCGYYFVENYIFSKISLAASKL